MAEELLERFRQGGSSPEEMAAEAQRWIAEDRTFLWHGVPYELQAYIGLCLPHMTEIRFNMWTQVDLWAAFVQRPSLYLLSGMNTINRMQAIQVVTRYWKDLRDQEYDDKDKIFIRIVKACEYAYVRVDPSWVFETEVLAYFHQLHPIASAVTSRFDEGLYLRLQPLLSPNVHHFHTVLLRATATQLTVIMRELEASRLYRYMKESATRFHLLRNQKVKETAFERLLLEVKGARQLHRIDERRDCAVEGQETIRLFFNTLKQCQVSRSVLTDKFQKLQARFDVEPGKKRMRMLSQDHWKSMATTIANHTDSFRRLLVLLNLLVPGLSDQVVDRDSQKGEDDDDEEWLDVYDRKDVTYDQMSQILDKAESELPHKEGKRVVFDEDKVREEMQAALQPSTTLQYRSRRYGGILDFTLTWGVKVYAPRYLTRLLLEATQLMYTLSECYNSPANKRACQELKQDFYQNAQNQTKQ